MDKAKKKCEDCEGYSNFRYDFSLGVCEKHAFEDVSGDAVCCSDFVDKDTYQQCRYYHGHGDYENEFCANSMRTGRLCSMQSNCKYFGRKEL